MGLTVDQIESVLTAKTGQYVKAYQDATKAHVAWREEHAKEPANDTVAAKRVASVKKVADAEKTEAKAASAAVKAAEKEKADAVRAAAKAASDAVKAAEREKQAAIKATAKEAQIAAKATAVAAAAEKVAAAEVVAAIERETAARVRLAAVAERAVAGRGVTPGSGRNLGVISPNEPSGQRSIPLATLNGEGAAAEVAAETEINFLLRDRVTLQAGLIGATAEEKNIIRDQLTEMKLINDYKKAGIGETEAAILAEEVLLKIQQRRAATAAGTGPRIGNITKFAEGAGLGRTGGGAAAVTGIVLAAGVASIVSLTKSGLDYAQSLKVVSDQIGVTTHDLQIYQAAAATVNVTQEQLREGLGQLAGNLGKAQLGAETQKKQFKDLGIDIGNARDGFKSTSEILPTFLNVLSKIPDQAKRLAVETALGGDQLRRLDPILSRGADGFDKLAGGIAGTSDMLSDTEIQRAAETANKLKLVGDQLQRDLSSAVATNAAGIENLAKAFFHVAEGAIKAFNASQRYLSFAALNTPGGTPEQRQFASDTINSTPEGRRQRMARLRNSYDMLNQQRDPKNQSTSDLYVDSVGYISNTPQGRGAAKKQLIDQYRQVTAAERADNPPPTPAQPSGKTNLDDFFAGKPKKPRKGKSEDTLEAEALASQKRFTADLERERAEQLSLESDLTSDTAKRREIALQRIDSEQKAKDAEIKTAAEEEIKRRKLSGASADEIRVRADALIKQNDINAGLERAKIAQDKIADDLEQGLKDAQVQADLRTQELDDRLALAKTAKERREIENDLLLLAADEKKKALNEKIANPNTDPRDLPGLRDQLRAVDADTAAKQQANNRTNASPFDQFRDNIHKSSQQITEDLQTIEVQGINSLNDGLEDAIVNSKSLGDVFHNVAKQILSDLIKIGLQAAESAAFGSPGGGGGSFAGLISGIGSIFSGGSSPGYANTSSTLSFTGARAGGGQVSAGKFYKVNEFGTEGYASFDKPGKIVPLGEMNSRGGNTTIVQQSFTLDARYGITTPELIDHVNAVATTQAARAGKASYDASQANAPGRIRQYQTLEG